MFSALYYALEWIDWERCYISCAELGDIGQEGNPEGTNAKLSCMT